MSRAKRLFLVMLDNDGTSPPVHPWVPPGAPVVTMNIEDGVWTGAVDNRVLFDRYLRPAFAQLRHDWTVEQERVGA